MFQLLRCRNGMTVERRDHIVGRNTSFLRWGARYDSLDIYPVHGGRAIAQERPVVRWVLDKAEEAGRPDVHGRVP